MATMKLSSALGGGSLGIVIFRHEVAHVYDQQSYVLESEMDRDALTTEQSLRAISVCMATTSTAYIACNVVGVAHILLPLIRRGSSAERKITDYDESITCI